MQRSASSVWAITAYFDPLSTRERLEAFREFHQRLQVPLAAVELSYNGSFDLGDGDADILIPVRGGAVLWQKERLLNLALAALPASCTTVAWVDCDVVFTRDDWHVQGERMLERARLVQPFDRLYYLEQPLAPQSLSAAARSQPFESIASRYLSGKLPADSFTTIGNSQKIRYAPGMVWMARRDLLERCGGLYDAEIVGAGDKLIFAAGCGRHEELARALLNPAHAQHYCPWAERFYREVQGRIAYTSGDLLHIWHGDLADRQYAERRHDFGRFAFDPATDLRQNAEGAWCWNSDKPALHSHMRALFQAWAAARTAAAF